MGISPAHMQVLFRRQLTKVMITICSIGSSRIPRSKILILYCGLMEGLDLRVCLVYSLKMGQFKFYVKIKLKQVRTF